MTDRYVLLDNGDGTHRCAASAALHARSTCGRTWSVRDTVEHCWVELDGSEDMLPHQARSLKSEYESGDAS